MDGGFLQRHLINTETAEGRNVSTKALSDYQLVKIVQGNSLNG